MTREEIDVLLESYRDGTIAPEAAAELARLLDAGGERARSARSHWALMGQLGQALDGVDGDAMVASFQERLRAETSGSRIVRGVERLRAADARGRSSASQRAAARRSRRLLPTALAAAAVLLLLLSALLLHGQRERGAATGAALSAKVSALSGAARRLGGAGAAERALELGDELAPGDRLQVAAAGALTLRYADGSDIGLDAGCQLELLPAPAPTPASKRLRLAAGTLHAQVAHQRSGQPLVVETAHARCEVIGTTFAIDAAPDHTRLTVYAGLVAMAAGAAKVEVAANQYAIGAPGTVLAVHDLNAPAAPAPAPALPAPSAPLARLLDGFELAAPWSHEPYSGPLAFARSQERAHGGSWSLRIDYQRDVSDRLPYAQILRAVALAPGERSVRLWLWVERCQAEARWQVQLHDRDNCYWKTAIREFDASPGWHEVRIAIPEAPERAFAPPGHQDDPFRRDHIDALAFNFFGGDAVLFIDDIELLAAP